MPDIRKDALEYIISNKLIKTVFQPIISLRDGSILGHEALSRITCDSEITNPEMLFAVAGEYNRMWDLELLCRTVALETAYKFMIPPYNKRLFLNVNPNTMHDENFKKGFTREFLQQYKIVPNNVIFEITERNVITEMDSFLTAINHYRSQDYQIAIDDAGAGYSGLNLISDINPNFIKLDMKLIRGIDGDNLKYALVKGMVELSKTSNISLIAEGIETYEEFKTLIKLGVQYGQGYFIQRPDSEIQILRWDLLQMINEINLSMNQSYSSNISNTCIKNICTYTGIVAASVTADFVYHIFKNNPGLMGLCIIENEIPIGIITHQKLAQKMSGHYGFSLNQHKRITELMDISFLSVDCRMPISTVSLLAMSRSNDSLYDFIVVTENSKYIGTVTIKDLLQKTTEMEVAAAKNLNPLSGLPGNLLVEQRLNQCVTNNMIYSIAYLDIDNFKAYNDVYGFENGDLVIKLLSNTLRIHLPEEYFIGHIGGDDFVVIANDLLTDVYFNVIKYQFEQEVRNFYNPVDIQNGYITTVNRHGITEQFPIITLTIVVATSESHCFQNVYELTEMLAKQKRLTKQRKLTNTYQITKI
ncbi:MAG: diguanylate cyclase/phosphodiesterase [Herbinix sp.]|jgi:EAL domain-containing protein (putative c-di-GMP-specific phosphodiesterase class I)/GGDEF domain-containing protein|nr:diguanylate cyclase/phosphodiesterase [Herbinix sp.]